MSSSFTPFITNITNITNAQEAVVTVIETPPYSIGEIVSLRVSKPYGMTEVNNVSTRVLDVSGNDITIELDTLGLTTFVYPPIGEVVKPALVIPSASGIVPDSPIPMTNLQDAFDNIPED